MSLPSDFNILTDPRPQTLRQPPSSLKHHHHYPHYHPHYHHQRSHVAGGSIITAILIITTIANIILIILISDHMWREAVATQVATPPLRSVDRGPSAQQQLGDCCVIVSCCHGFFLIQFVKPKEKEQILSRLTTVGATASR